MKQSIKLLTFLFGILVASFCLYVVVTYKGFIPRRKIWVTQTLDNFVTSSYSSNRSISLLKSLNSFPWAEYEASVDSPSFLHFSSQLLSTLFPFLIMPPKIEVNQHCTPPTLKFPSYLGTCSELSTPRKVGVLVQFGFESDTLEIHLHELEDVVDYVFILESTRAHFRGIKKPLLWEALKRQARFQQFSEKIVHIILDDVDTLDDGLQEKGFGIEALQEKQRWKKFLQWNDIKNYFQDNDILGFGDVDEIPSRDVVFYMKNCEIPSDPVDIGIWFPFGKINQAFRTDWPVSEEHLYSLGDPSYWTLQKALKTATGTTPPSRMRGQSTGHLLGGMHMSYYGYLPLRIVKQFTASESNKDNFIYGPVQKLKTLTDEKMLKMEAAMSEPPTPLTQRIKGIDEFKTNHPREYEQIVHFPWFYVCNKKRYPAWEGIHDTRLD